MDHVQWTTLVATVSSILKVTIKIKICKNQPPVISVFADTIFATLLKLIWVSVVQYPLLVATLNWGRPL